MFSSESWLKLCIRLHTWQLFGDRFLVCLAPAARSPRRRRKSFEGSNQPFSRLFGCSFELFFGYAVIDYPLLELVPLVNLLHAL